MKRALPVVALVVASAPLRAWAQEPLPPPDVAAPEPAAPESASPPATEEGPSPAPPPPVAVAPRPAPVTLEAPRGTDAARPPRLEYFRVGLGPRVMYVRSGGFDLFAADDVLASFAIDATTTAFRRGDLTLAVGAAWDAGGRSNGLRGFDSKLNAHRFTMPIEGRWHYQPWLYGFAKLAPGAAYVRARFDDKANVAIQDSAWAFAADVSVGASLLVVPHGSTERRTPRFWVTPELGYSFATRVSLVPQPGRDEKDVLGSDAAASLGSLSLWGFFWRATAAVTF